MRYKNSRVAEAISVQCQLLGLIPRIRVVAEDVRKLATASSDSIKEITVALRTIQASVNKMEEKSGTINGTTSIQATSIQEMATACQSLAILASDLNQVAETFYQE